MTRVFVIAPYGSTRAGLRTLLADEAEIEIVGDAPSAGQAVSALAELEPDVILADLDGRLDSVLELVSETALPLVLMTDSQEDLNRMWRDGALTWAQVSRSADGAEIAAGIGAVMSGLIAFERSLAPSIVEGRPQTETEELTAREVAVLELIAEGLPNKQIAVRLAISPHTAKFHVGSVMAKLGASSRTEAVAIGVRTGLLAL